MGKKFTEIIELGQHQTFEFNGVTITDPWMDETGRFEVDPIKYYGVKPVEEVWIVSYIDLEVGAREFYDYTNFDDAKEFYSTCAKLNAKGLLMECYYPKSGRIRKV